MSRDYTYHPQSPGSPGLETHLAGHGVLLRNLGNYGLSDCLRITIGSDEDSRRVLDLVAAPYQNV